MLLFVSASPTASPSTESACSAPPNWPTAMMVGNGAGLRYRDLPYWSGTNARLDVLLPTGWSGNAPATILFLHGGGGFSGSKYELAVRDFFFGMMRRGFPVVTVDYTLSPPGSPGGGFRAGLRDARAALAWVRRSTGGVTSGQDVCLPDCVVVVGSSAGAHLASLIGTTWNADDQGLYDPAISGANVRADLVVCVSGLYDLYGVGANGACPPTRCYSPPHNVRFPASGWCGSGSGWPAGYPALPGWEWALLPWGTRLPHGLWPPELWLGCRWGDVSCSPAPPGPLPTNALTGNSFADASALNWVDEGDTPFYLVHGVCDPITPYGQGEDFRDALVAAGVPVQLRSIEGSGHGLRPRTAGSNGLVSPAEGVAEVQQAIAFWNSLGGCTRAWSVRYGCGTNPRRSIRILDGHPRIGERVHLGLHNPAGSQAGGALSYVFVSTAPASGFPCGQTLPGYGMAGPAELLIDVGPAALVPLVFSGSPWNGAPDPAVVPIDFPADSALIGTRIYAQGLLLDLSGTGTRFGATDAVEFWIGG